MGVTTHNHPFPVFDRNAGVRGPSRKVPRFRVFLMKEALYIFDSLSEEKVLVLVSEQETNIPFLDQRERRWGRNVFEHVGSAGAITPILTLPP